MADKVHVRKGDKVYILSGKDRGKQGKVLDVVPSKQMVLVEGVNIETKHVKPRNRYQQGGIIHQESPINSSKVMLVCGRCGTPTKIGKQVLETGEKVRICKKCSEVIDTVRDAKENK